MQQELGVRAARAQVITPEGLDLALPAGRREGVSPGLLGTRPSRGGRCPRGQKPVQGRAEPCPLFSAAPPPTLLTDPGSWDVQVGALAQEQGGKRETWAREGPTVSRGEAGAPGNGSSAWVYLCPWGQLGHSGGRGWGACSAWQPELPPPPPKDPRLVSKR